MRVKYGHRSRATILEITAILQAILWRNIASQCSEAHAVACSWSVMQMTRLSTSLFPISGFLPDYNQTMLREVCITFNEFVNCSQPFLDHCDETTVKDIHLLKSAFIPVCGQYFKDYILHRSCYQSLESTYQVCQNKRRREHDLSALKHQSRIVKQALTCSATNQYVKCVYLATALRCSLEAANVCFQIINQSISLLLQDTDFMCKVHHPSDVVSVFTTSERTSHTSTSMYRRTSTVAHVVFNSGTNLHFTFSSYPHLICFVIFFNILYDHVHI